MKYMTTRKNDLFNDMFDDVFRAPVFTGNNILKTDVREKDGKYILEVEVPGYKKDEVSISLKKGSPIDLDIYKEKHLLEDKLVIKRG